MVSLGLPCGRQKAFLSRKQHVSVIRMKNSSDHIFRNLSKRYFAWKISNQRCHLVNVRSMISIAALKVIKMKFVGSCLSGGDGRCKWFLQTRWQRFFLRICAIFTHHLSPASFFWLNFMLELMRPPFTVNMKHYISIPQVRSINILTTRAKENSDTNFPLGVALLQEYDFDGLTRLV